MKDSAETDRVIDRFDLIVNGPALFNAVVAALEFDIFSFLHRSPHSSFDQIREYVGIQPHKMRVLLHALCATELIELHESGYANSAAAEQLLVPDGADSWKHILLGWQKIYYPAFAETTVALREGRNTALDRHPGTEPTLYQRLSHDSQAEEVLHRSMAAFTLRSLDGLLDNIELAGVRRLLDVGGGDGTTATRLAARFPETEITVFDLPSVTQLAQDAQPDPGTGRPVRFHPGDLFADSFPRGMDTVLFSHVLEVFSEQQIVELLRKAFDALTPGGKIVLYGFNALDGERRGVYSARLSLYLNVLATGQGMAYPTEDYEKWLSQVGCVDVKSITGLPYEHGLITGTKK
ncbi:methyltransferase [Streptomyces sp. S.PNR 29]|uniref:methyltransferase n=1 Tax=Streptomyces sp. S.PNR 29 TaxID=2973805 RepID=UPI0025B21098|nr:methyltransferase [Streptomyces sp. S.PNR 29]MDN0193985.1 acetylserotonin O-methyltransferase [Streptomyces sp. S.PNR 29]